MEEYIIYNVEDLLEKNNIMLDQNMEPFISEFISMGNDYNLIEEMKLFRDEIESYALKNKLITVEESLLNFSKKEKYNIIISRPIIILFGFIYKLELDQLNHLLRAKGYDQLYARDYIDLTLIYSFNHHYSFDQWLELEKSFRNQTQDNNLKDSRDIFFFSSEKDLSKIILKELRNYVMHLQKKVNGEWVTISYTQDVLMKEISNVHNEDEFMDFYTKYKDELSNYRKKGHYYLCKMLLDFIDYRIDLFIKMKSTKTLIATYCNITLKRGNYTIPKSKFTYKIMESIKKEDFEDSSIVIETLYRDFSLFFHNFHILEPRCIRFVAIINKLIEDDQLILKQEYDICGDDEILILENYLKNNQSHMKKSDIEEIQKIISYQTKKGKSYLRSMISNNSKIKEILNAYKTSLESSPQHIIEHLDHEELLELKRVLNLTYRMSDREIKNYAIQYYEEYSRLVNKRRGSVKFKKIFNSEYDVNRSFLIYFGLFTSCSKEYMSEHVLFQSGYERLNDRFINDQIFSVVYDALPENKSQLIHDLIYYLVYKYNYNFLNDMLDKKTLKKEQVKIKSLTVGRKYNGEF